MASSVVAMHQGGGGALLLDADVGAGVHTTRQNAFAVLGQSNHAVTIRALQIGLGHESRHGLGISIRQTHGLQGGGHVAFELSNLDGGMGHGAIDINVQGRRS
jgi:hypothetical protein